MKKGLSVLLVAAALFGFYGSAVNLNDILACKDYWEEAGEKSTADMNKLEDGLNQLKENEAAYLDGKQQVADGEVALADAEKQLADGEAKLAEGRAELAKGEADYAAAPGKLAAARKQIAKGEKDLAAGEKKLADGKKTLADGKKQYAQGLEDYKNAPQKLKDGQESIDGLTKLINGIGDVTKNYGKKWKPGFDKLKDGRAQLYDGSKDSKDDLTALAAFLPEDSQKAYAAAVADVAGDDEKQTADDYKDFIKSTNAMAEALPVIQKTVETYDKQANQLLKGMQAPETNFDFAQFVSAQKKGLLALAELITDEKDKATFVGGVNQIADAYDNYDKTVDAKYKEFMASDEGKATEAKLVSDNMDNGWAAFFQTDNGKKAIAGTKVQVAIAMGLVKADASDEEKAAAASKIDDDTAKKQFRESDSDQAKAAAAGIKQQVTAQVDDGIKANVAKQVKDAMNDSSNKEAGAQLTAGRKALTDAVAKIAGTLDAVNEQVNGEKSKIKNALLPGLQQFNDAATEDAIDTLSDGQAQLAGGISTIASAVYNTPALKAGVKAKMGSKALKLMKAYMSKNSPISTKAADFAAFEGQMDTNPGLVTVLTKARGLLQATKTDGLKTLAAGKKDYKEAPAKLAAARKQLSQGEKDLAAGEKELAAGKKKLADGKKQYAQGLKDYAAAPGKLAAGRQQLAEGEATLADGYAQYEEGQKTLADGKAQLAQYEDGEQQVRDGLATLVGTEADLDLESILDRLNGDSDFDNGDGHLDLDEGLAAVEVGRGYQAEDGELITKEITARAVGTAGLLGAGVLAVLAAILSFLKKNKGAGISAILAACAGAFGAFYGTNAGTYFSNIAGSTAGNAGWVAAGILGVIALVHAIAHFTAKKEA